MYKILLCCSAGMTTNMLVNSMKEEAKKENIDVMVWAVAETAIGLSWADADCVLVAPQIASSLSKIKEMVTTNIPIEVINSEDFSKMNGKKVLEHAISLIK